MTGQTEQSPERVVHDSKVSGQAPSREDVLNARIRSQAAVAASRRGKISFDEARAECQRYIDLNYARQKAIFGCVKQRVSINHLMR